MEDFPEYEKILSKIRRFCVYRDRSEKEVRDKLRQYGLSSEKAETILLRLKKENFVNDDRFARQYIRGKFYVNRWGKRKIRAGLRQHALDKNLIDIAPEQEIPPEAYMSAIRLLIHRQLEKYAGLPPEKILPKIYRYLESKGYEPEIFYEILKDELR